MSKSDMSTNPKNMVGDAGSTPKSTSKPQHSKFLGSDSATSQFGSGKKTGKGTSTEKIRSAILSSNKSSI